MITIFTIDKVPLSSHVVPYCLYYIHHSRLPRSSPFNPIISGISSAYRMSTQDCSCIIASIRDLPASILSFSPEPIPPLLRQSKFPKFKFPFPLIFCLLDLGLHHRKCGELPSLSIPFNCIIDNFSPSFHRCPADHGYRFFLSETRRVFKEEDNGWRCRFSEAGRRLGRGSDDGCQATRSPTILTAHT